MIAFDAAVLQPHQDELVSGHADGNDVTGVGDVAGVTDAHPAGGPPRQAVGKVGAAVALDFVGQSGSASKPDLS